MSKIDGLNIDKIIKIYQNAHKAADENLNLLMTTNHNSLITDLCAARMKCTEIADQILYTLKGQKNIPIDLHDFFVADEDKECSDCRYLACGPEHPECIAKLNRWNNAQKKLMNLWK